MPHAPHALLPIRNPSITSSNAALAIQDQTIKVNVFYEAGNSASTQMIMSFLAVRKCRA